MRRLFQRHRIVRAERGRVALPPLDHARIVAIRPADPTDRPVLDRLAELDSALPMRGPALVAVVDGEPWAAVSLASGRTIADPTRPSDDAVALLRLRAERLAAATPAGLAGETV